MNMMEKTISIVGKQCFGCAGCMSICPQNCIQMMYNEEGFLYPSIDSDSCVQCGLCYKKCPVVTDDILREQFGEETWAVISKDKEILLQSSSGGFFSTIAGFVLENGGSVYGAAFSDDFLKVEHVRVERIEDLSRLRGSKYIQSDMHECYEKVKDDLTRSKQVLFTGTPCQIGALKSIVGEDNNLICVDVICHGTPSVSLWKAYLQEIERKTEGKAIQINLRDKTMGWKDFCVSIRTENEKKYTCSMHNDPFMRLFLRNFSLRESCYKCRIKEKGSLADITMGDYWGVDAVHPEIDSHDGVSLVILHNEKGEKLFEAIKHRIDSFPTDYYQALLHNSAYLKSVKRPIERDSFYRDLHTIKWKEFIHKYMHESVLLSFKRGLKKRIKTFKNYLK